MEPINKNYTYDHDYNKFKLKTKNISNNSAHINQILNTTFTLTNVVSDGNCLFRTFAELIFHDQERYSEIKLYIINFVCCNKNNYESLINRGSFSVQDEYGNNIDHPRLYDFLKMIARERVWGNEGSIFAMSDALKVIIIIISIDRKTHENDTITKYVPNTTISSIPLTIINETQWHFIAAHRKLDSSIFDKEIWQNIRIIQIKIDSNAVQPTEITSKKQDSITIPQSSSSFIGSDEINAQSVLHQFYCSESFRDMSEIMKKHQKIIIEIYNNIKSYLKLTIEIIIKKVLPQKEE